MFFSCALSVFSCGVLSFISSCAKCGKSVVSGCSGGGKSKVEKVLQRFTIRDYKEYM